MTLTARRMRPIALLILGVACATQVPAAVTDVTQTFVLQPGWNSVFLEVRPEANEAEAVFGGLPLASAWTWNPAGPKVEFIDDPTEQMVPSPQWLGYFPRPRPESILTNLFAVQANRAYLLKIDGNVPVTWTVTGTPEVQDYRWAPDSFNLVGFPVDPQQQPTFGQFLAPSPAHVGQPIYRLVAGQWQEIASPFGTAIQLGRGLLGFLQGAVGLQRSDRASSSKRASGSTSAPAATARALRIRNLTTAPVSISLRQVPSSAPIPLAISPVRPRRGRESAWPTLPQTYSLPVPQEGELLLDLAPRRANFGAVEVGTVIEIKDGFGFRRLLAVSARGAFAPTPFEQLRAQRRRQSDAADDRPVDRPARRSLGG